VCTEELEVTGIFSAVPDIWTIGRDRRIGVAPCAQAHLVRNGARHVKNAKTVYWTVTGLMAAFMLLASVPDLLRIPQAVSIFGHLGYPVFLLPFLGTAKALGVIAVLLPGFRGLKEWAFAGLVFDLIGALYSHLSVGDPPSDWMPAAIGLVLVGGSYLAWRAQLTADTEGSSARGEPLSAH
jgi:hypothetical protein